jgi:hypothetical protein
MTSFLSVMQYQVTAGVAFAAILHSIGGSITATIVAGLGFAAVIGLSWALVMRDAAYGSAVHSAVGNVISCIGLIAIVLRTESPGHGRIVIRRSRIVWTKGAATAPFSMVRLMLHIQAVVPGLGAPKWPTTLGRGVPAVVQPDFGRANFIGPERL